MQKIKFIIFSLLAMLISCSGNEENSYQANVYIVGGNDIGEPIATSVLWINDDVVELSAKSTGVNSVYVNDGNIYTAGYRYEDEYYNSPYYATLWTNGNIATLSQHTSCAFSVFAEGKVYVAGYEKIEDNPLATLWVNGVATRLSNFDSKACSVFVSQGIIYVVGRIKNDDGICNAVVWKNGISTILSTNPSFAYSVFVKNGNVYIAGDDNDNATLWVNGEAETLSNEYSAAYSVFVENNKVYVAGENNNAATLWVNGVSTALSTDYSSASSVFVAGGNVYVAGISDGLIYHQVGFPTLWVNGEQKILSTEGATRFIDPFNFYVSGIFVK